MTNHQILADRFVWNLKKEKYSTINCTTFRWNNMTLFLNYQILADWFVLNLKMWKNSSPIYPIDILLLVMKSEEIARHLGLHPIVNRTCVEWLYLYPLISMRAMSHMSGQHWLCFCDDAWYNEGLTRPIFHSSGIWCQFIEWMGLSSWFQTLITFFINDKFRLIKM